MKKFLNKIICGDCLEVMKKLPDESVDLIITDPPYGVDYDGGHFHSGDVNIKRTRERLKGDQQPNVYKWLFKELYRILKTGGGGAYVFYASGVGKDIFSHICFDKYQVLIWYKTNATFASIMARYHHTFEPFLYLTKKSPTKWNGGTKERDIWEVKREPQNIFHPTQKPVELIEKMILNSSDEGDIILDPFLGSGTTAVACQRLHRNFIGIEISEKYCRIARDRLKQQVLL